MAFCPECGGALRDDIRFCAGCGTAVNPLRESRSGPTASAPALAPTSPAPSASPSPSLSAPSAALSPSNHADELPKELREYMAELEEWALLNYRDSKKDSLRYWCLKVPAVVSSACAGIITLTGLQTLAAILAAIASACILVDAVQPGGQLRNAHLRAVHDLRSLQHKLMNDWRIGCLRREAHANLAANILVAAQEVRSKIEADLRAAETLFAQTERPH